MVLVGLKLREKVVLPCVVVRKSVLGHNVGCVAFQGGAWGIVFLRAFLASELSDMYFLVWGASEGA